LMLNSGELRALAADVVSLGILKEGLAIGTHTPHSYDEIGRDAGFRSVFHGKEAVDNLDPDHIILTLEFSSAVIEMVADPSARLSQIVIRDQFNMVSLQQFAAGGGGQDLQLLLS
jgi:hypothetical protein